MKPDEIIRKHFPMMEETIYKNHKIFIDGTKIKETKSAPATIYIKGKNITTVWKLPKETQIEAELFAIKKH